MPLLSPPTLSGRVTLKVFITAQEELHGPVPDFSALISLMSPHGHINHLDLPLTPQAHSCPRSFAHGVPPAWITVLQIFCLLPFFKSLLKPLLMVPFQPPFCPLSWHHPIFLLSQHSSLLNVICLASIFYPMKTGLGPPGSCCVLYSWCWAQPPEDTHDWVFVD